MRVLARQARALFIDVNELTDRTDKNALKIVGDVYAARLFSLVGAMLDLDRWKGNVSEKLKTLDAISTASRSSTSASCAARCSEIRGSS